MARATVAGQEQVMVRMPVELHDEVKRLAAERDISMAQAIRAAIRAWIQDPRLVP